MDDVAIQKIAAAIVAYLPTYSWVPLIVQSVLTGVVAAVVLFLSDYFRTRGRNLATRADFDSLQQQLHANTELVETIKADVGQRDWAKREWTNLRRLKLEALLDKMQECEEHLDQHRHNSIDGKVGLSSDPGFALDTIQALYFSELSREIGAYLLIYRERIAAGNDLKMKLLEVGANCDARQQAFDEFTTTSGNSASFRERNKAVQAVKSSARKLLVEIMGAE
jgi:hypothetical protein